MVIETVSIIGLGALGVMYGKQILDQIGREQLRIVADTVRINRYKETGIYCNGNKCDFQYIDADHDCKPADLLILAVKYSGLKNAIAEARHQVGSNTIIISLLNGITSEQIIGKAYGFDKLLYCVAQGMDPVKKNNQVDYVNMGSLSFGEANDERSEKVQALSQFFDHTGIAYEIPEHALHKLWSKLMLNTGVNQSVAVFETNYHGVQVPGRPRDAMIGAMEEVIAVANKEGVNLKENEVNYWISIIDKLNPSGMPSMRQDTLAHRKTEVDLFSGTIVALGKKHHVATPINNFFYLKLKEIEASFL